jgi:hypothetical protein
MRRMYGGYFKGFRNAGKLRAQIMEKHSRADVLEFLLNFDDDAPEVQVVNAKALGVKRAMLPAAS